MEVFLDSGFNEILLGTVEEITGTGGLELEGIGMSFRAVISDIVADMLYESEFPGDTGLTEAIFTIKLR